MEVQLIITGIGMCCRRRAKEKKKSIDSYYQLQVISTWAEPSLGYPLPGW